VRDFGPTSSSPRALPPAAALAVITFPCQDVSSLGDRLLLSGKRTRLVDDALAAVKARADGGAPVPFLLLENVEGLLDRSRSDGGVEVEAVIAHVLSGLDTLDYDVAYRLVDAVHIPGADGRPSPMSRPRVLMVAAHRATGVNPADLLLAQDFRCDGACAQPCGACFQRNGCPRACNAAGVWRNAKLPWLQRLGVGWDLSCYWSLPRLGVLPCFLRGNNRVHVFLSNARFGLLCLRDAVRLFGVAETWFDRLRSAKRGRSGAAGDGHRGRVWQFLGDAVYGPMFAWIGARIVDHERLAGGFDMALAEPLPGGTPAPQEAWPRAGLLLRGTLYRVKVGPAPCYAPYTPLGAYFDDVDDTPVDAAAVAFSLAKMDEAVVLAGPFRRVADRVAGLAAALDEEPPVRRSQRFCGAPPPTVRVAARPVFACGACDACLAHPRAACALSGALWAAMEGHAGAQLALRQGGAVGLVVSLRGRLGEVEGFEAATGAHRVAFYDGSKAARVRLWAEEVRVVRGE